MINIYVDVQYADKMLVLVKCFGFWAMIDVLKLMNCWRLYCGGSRSTLLVCWGAKQRSIVPASGGMSLTQNSIVGQSSGLKNNLLS